MINKIVLNTRIHYDENFLEAHLLNSIIDNTEIPRPYYRPTLEVVHRSGLRKQLKGGQDVEYKHKSLGATPGASKSLRNKNNLPDFVHTITPAAFPREVGQLLTLFTVAMCR